ncbi:MAG: tRNA (adenosine(37)-N6)-threonylcarbamoyltransferase complex ATPase subunit type 1 TsaE [Pseudomonadota bacterium]
MDTQIIPIDTLAQTEALARRLGAIVQPGDFVALYGGLGAGKTTFARGLISAVCGTPCDVPSPTYTLVQTYDGPAFTIFHMDLYRLERPEDVFELGWDETAEGLTLVEWPERAGAYLPEWRLDMRFEAVAETRKVRLEPCGEDWQTRLNEL